MHRGSVIEGIQGLPYRAAHYTSVKNCFDDGSVLLGEPSVLHISMLSK